MRLAFRPFSAVACIAIVAIASTRVSAQSNFYTSNLLYKVISPGGNTHTVSSDPQAVAVGGQVVGWYSNGTISNDAAVWSPPSGTFTDIHPGTGYTISFAEDTNGTVQVGSARVAPGSNGFNDDRAMMWTGTAATATNLHPTLLAGFRYSTADGVSPSGLQQVGWAYRNVQNDFHALVWASTPESALDLNPTNLAGTWVESYALATNGTQQVGYGEHDFGDYHALMWSGAANTAVDLHPTNITGYIESQANGISSTGSHQVGYGDGTATSGNSHALLWSGSANSAVDLHPTLLTGFSESFAMACNDTIQAGFGKFTASNSNHAMAWIGTADSAMDLQSDLPTTNGGFWLSSEAYAVDANGNVWGIARGTPDSNLPGGDYVVEWIIPEPGCALMTCLCCAGYLCTNRRRRADCNRRV